MQPLKIAGSKKKKSTWLLKVIIIAIIGVVAFFTYRFAPHLYYQFSGDALIRVQKKHERINAKIMEGKGTPEELLPFIEDSERILDAVVKEKVSDPMLYVLQGTTEIYKLRLRVPMNGKSLLELAGRGFLPTAQNIKGLHSKPLIQEAENISSLFRKATALDPTLQTQGVAELGIALGELMHTGRTDPILLQYIDTMNKNTLPDSLTSTSDWLTLGVLSLTGKIEPLMKRAEAIRKEQLSSIQEKRPSKALPISEEELKLIESFGAFHGKDYFNALRLAREVKSSPIADAYMKLEATRLEGEIFLIQSGPDTARFFFQQAALYSKQKDPFLEERIVATKAPQTP